MEEEWIIHKLKRNIEKFKDKKFEKEITSCGT